MGDKLDYIFVNAYELTQLDTSDTSSRYRIRSFDCDIEINEKTKGFLDYANMNAGKTHAETIAGYLAVSNSSEEEVRFLIKILKSKGILVTRRSEVKSINQLQRQPKHRNNMKNLVFNKRIIDTDYHANLFRFFSPVFKKKVTVSLVSCYILLDGILLYLHFFTSWGDKLLYLTNFDYVAVFLLLSPFVALFHEFGHISAMKLYGLSTPKGIGIGLYFHIVVFYSDTHEAWELPSKQRMIVSGAGVIFNLLILIPLQLACFYFKIAAIRDFLILFHFTLISIFNPFLKMDGYWLVSDVLGVPNLHAKICELIDFRFGKSKRMGFADKHPLATYPKRVRKGVNLYLYLFIIFSIIFLGIFVLRTIEIVLNFNSVILHPALSIVQGDSKGTELVNTVNLLLRNIFIMGIATLYFIQHLLKIHKKQGLAKQEGIR